MPELQKVGAFQMLPPAPGLCQECAVDHKPEEPHNQESLYYQVSFHAKNGRYPTWTDAMAHCDPEIRMVWIHALIGRFRELDRPVPVDLMEATMPGQGRE